jgi:hypothetical protein
VLCWTFTAVAEERLRDILYLFLIRWFPEYQRVVVLVDPCRKSFVTELFDLFVIDIKVAVALVHVVWVVWLVIVGLQHNTRI